MRTDVYHLRIRKQANAGEKTVVSSTMQALGGRLFYRYPLRFEKCTAGNQYSGCSPSARIVELTTGSKTNTFDSTVR